VQLMKVHDLAKYEWLLFIEQKMGVIYSWN
jgi:hypothetical protein